MSAHVFYTEDGVIEFEDGDEASPTPPADRPIVAKVGGATAVDPTAIAADVAHLIANGRRVVVVHGGSTAVDELLERLGMEPTYVETPDGIVGRFTDAEAMEAVTMAVAGGLNTALTATFRDLGVNAVGLSGVDGGLVVGPRKRAVRALEGGKVKVKRGDHSGRPESIDAELLELLLDAGFTPVVGPPMAGEEPADGQTPVNVDADRLAAAVAAELGGELVLLTDVEGVLEVPDDPTTRIEEVRTPAGFEALEAAAEGFMARKVMAAKEALATGATGVVVADGGRRKPVLGALHGDGTSIEPSAVGDGGEDGP